MSRPATASNASGSCGDTPNSRLLIKSVNPEAAAIPIATPTKAIFALAALRPFAALSTTVCPERQTISKFTPAL